MKTTTVTKYETSDGRAFTDEAKAQRHEIEVFAKGLIEADEDGKTPMLTTVKLFDLLIEHSEGFTVKLKELTGK